MTLWTTIAARIRTARGAAFSIERRERVCGGCINEAWLVGGADVRYFVKLHDADKLDMFEAEAAGLAELANAETLKVPVPVCTGTAAGRSFVVMEHIRLAARGDARALGRGMATLHGTTAPTFGWHRANYIGSTPQPNTQTRDWIDFWRENRLAHQLDLAARNGHGGSLQAKGERLVHALPVLFAARTPTPALLHGDLWGGNYAYDEHGNPVLFDPAVYYGDREADLAMTRLFGGFDEDFYAAYREAWPLDEGHQVRATFYNLYHVLNHLNLFGGGYARQAERMMDAVLAECRD